MPPEGRARSAARGILTYEELVRFLRISLTPVLTRCASPEANPWSAGPGRPRRHARRTRGRHIPHYQRHPAVAAGGRAGRRGLEAGKREHRLLDPDTFHRITRAGDLSDALAGVEAALEAGLEPVKINMGCSSTSSSELEGFVELVRRLPVHVRFIEYMRPCGIFDGSYYVSAEEIKRRLSESGELTRSDLPPLRAGPARYYSLRGARGTIGFISPGELALLPRMQPSPPYSGRPDEPCLFSREEDDVREILRGSTDDAPVLDAIRRSLARNRATTAASRSPPGRSMSQIGG